ncbi:Laminin subunit gamma-3, partial [Dissostichus eleginoides]
EWVTATDLLISLDRLNTFGDEFFKDAKVLRSYFYAISDFSVGGRILCRLPSKSRAHWFREQVESVTFRPMLLTFKA